MARAADSRRNTNRHLADARRLALSARADSDTRDKVLHSLHQAINALLDEIAAALELPVAGEGSFALRLARLRTLGATVPQLEELANLPEGGGPLANLVRALSHRGGAERQLIAASGVAPTPLVDDEELADCCHHLGELVDRMRSGLQEW